MTHSHQQAVPGVALPLPLWRWRFEGQEVKSLPAVATNRCLQVESGKLWLTPTLKARARCGEQAAQDHWLLPGQSFFLPAGTSWVVQGFEGASATVAQLPPAVTCRSQARSLALGWGLRRLSRVVAPLRRRAGRGAWLAF